MKNILFLTWKDIKHPDKWWAEIIIYKYMRWLVKKWYNVVWFASWFDNWIENEIVDWIKIIRRYNINNIYFNTFKWYLEYKKNNKIDLIIDEAWGIPLLSPLYEKKIPIIFFIHHIWDKEWDNKFLFPINKLFKFFFNQILKLYKNNTTICVSQSTKDELIKNHLFKKDLVNVIENICDIKPIQNIDFNSKTNSILFIWRLMPIKRVEDSILAFKYFCDIAKHKNFNENYVLNIIWNNQDKKYFNKLKKIVIDLNIVEKVNFLWKINNNEFENTVNKNKILLVSSFKEWFWLVVHEWNCFWIPAIWYKVCGLRDSIKDWINWFLVEDWNYKKMWEKIYELVLDNEKFKKISNSSLEYVKSLPNWDIKIGIFEKIIQNHLN